MKKTFSLLIVFSMLLSMAVLPTYAAAPTSGITFTADDNYTTTSKLDEIPRTIEAWVKVDKDAPDTRLGVIFGNYVSVTVQNTNGKLLVAYNASVKLYGDPAGVKYAFYNGNSTVEAYRL